MAIITGVKSTLLTHNEIIADLATFDFGDGVQRPAIFSRSEPALESPNPCIALELISGDSLGDRGRRGSTAEVQVNIWGDKIGSDKPLRTLAMNVWRALDRSSPTITGYTTLGSRATNPQAIPMEDNFKGYFLIHYIKILEVI